MLRALEILRTSNNNDERRETQQQLREYQQRSPAEFLTAIIPLATAVDDAPGAEANAFFCSTVLLEFIDSFWRIVPDDAKSEALSVLMQLITSHPFHHARGPHCRKLCVVFAVMVKHLPRKSDKALQVLSVLVQCVEQSEHLRVQCLVAIHVLLKEMLAKRIGKLFEQLCGFVSPYLVRWLSADTSDQTKMGMHVLCLKIALRVYGHGVFDSSALQQLLGAAFSLAQRIHEGTQTVRALEYACKIVAAALETFASRLEQLPVSLFVVDEEYMSHTPTLFRFIFLVAQVYDPNTSTSAASSSSESSPPLFSAKLACRSMRLLTFLATQEWVEGTHMMHAALSAFCHTSTCHELVRLLVTKYFPDPESTVAELWVSDPERLVADLDLLDDENDPASCAEQLFLALTSNACTAPSCVSGAWSMVRELLNTSGGHLGTAGITAALHTVGLGYATLSAGGGAADYVEFLQACLLPILHNAAPPSGGQPNASGAVAPCVVRRVVWVTGMWVEALVVPALRREVHAALLPWLYPGCDPVLTLTALRAVEHFVSDNHFSVAELVARGGPSHGGTSAGVQEQTEVTVILDCLRYVLPNVRTACMIKELVGLCLVLAEKGAITQGGEAVLFVLQPAVQHCIQHADALETHNDDDLGEDHHDGGSSAELVTFCLLLETMSTAVRLASSPSVIWEQFPLVRYCTDPKRTVSTWTQDVAWELLLTMLHYSGCANNSTQSDSAPAGHGTSGFLEALFWCMANWDREFESRSLVIRCVTAIATVAVPLGALCDSDIQALVSRTSSELFTSCDSVFQSYVGLASVLVTVAPRLTSPVLLPQLLRYHYSVNAQSVQEDERLPSLAALLGQIVIDVRLPFTSICTESDRQLFVVATPPLSQTLIEKWSLVGDVTTNAKASEWIALAACRLVELNLVGSEEDVAVATAMRQSFEADSDRRVLLPGGYSPTGGCEHHAHHQDLSNGVIHIAGAREGSVDSTRADASHSDDGEAHEARRPVEVLLEWLGDGSVKSNCPHAQRIASLFGIAM